MARDELARLLERLAITEVIERYATGVDRRDWALFRSCFTDPVEIDLSSWNGLPAQSMPLDAWVNGVRAGLSGFDATQHIVSNHVIEVDADEAHCTSYVQATHGLDGERVVLGGHYDRDLVRGEDGWKIRSSRLTVTWREGSDDLFAAAARRAAETGPR